MITRSLGAEQYGIFNLLKLVFEEIINFFDTGTAAFYPKLSRQPGNNGIIRFVVLYDAILFILSFMFLAILFIFGSPETILTTKSISILVLVLVWLLLVIRKISFIMDAIEKTITNEVVMTVMRITLSVGIVMLYIDNSLNLTTFLVIQNCTIFIFLIISLRFAYKYIPRGKASNTIKETSKVFKQYSMPLIWASAITIITGLAERAILQYFDGSVAQGHYSLGFNTAAVCIMLTGCMSSLLLREYAIAFEKNDKKKLVYLLKKYLPLFYVITGIIGCYAAVHGDWLAPLIGGTDFRQAGMPVALMCLATLHQTYGQICGAFMSATDRTRELGGIAIFIAFLGLTVTYFMVAPGKYWGLNIGATGLAMKLVIVQIIAVNIQLWFVVRYLKIGISRFLFHQVLVLVVFLTFGFTVKYLVGMTFAAGITALLVSGALYLILVIMLIVLFPRLIVMNRFELFNHAKTLSVFFKS